MNTVKDMVALRSLVIGLVVLSLLLGCQEPQNNTAPQTVTENKPKVEVPHFVADSAFLFTKQQVEFGPRAMNTKAHDRCADFLANKMREYADTVIVQKGQARGWDGKMLNMQNIIASFSPEKKNRILLCSHWDSRPWADQDTVRQKEPIEAANDGAAGVGVLMEVARILKANTCQVGVDVIFFDAEDYGQPENSGMPESPDSWCLGSQYWSRNLHVPGYTANFGILLDMIGAKDAVYTQEGHSLQYASGFVQKVWDAGAKAGFSANFSREQTYPIIDDHYYINTLARIPCVDIIQYDYSSRSKFYRNWHTHQDKLEFIDKNSLYAVGQTLLEVVFNEN